MTIHLIGSSYGVHLIIFVFNKPQYFHKKNVHINKTHSI